MLGKDDNQLYILDEFEIIESSRYLSKLKREQTDQYRTEELKPIAQLNPHSHSDINFPSGPIAYANGEREKCRSNSINISWKLLITSWSLALVASFGTLIYMNMINDHDDQYGLIKFSSIGLVKLEEEFELIPFHFNSSSSCNSSIDSNSQSLTDKNQNVKEQVKINDFHIDAHSGNDSNDSKILFYNLFHCYKFIGLHTNDIESIGHQIISFKGLKNFIASHYQKKRNEWKGGANGEKRKNSKRDLFDQKNNQSNVCSSSHEFSSPSLPFSVSKSSSSNENFIERYNLNLIYEWILKELEWCFKWIPNIESIINKNENGPVIKAIKDQMKHLKCTILKIKNQCSIKKNECNINAISNLVFQTSKRSMKRFYDHIARIKNKNK